MAANVSRRDFARLFAIGGSAALIADPVWAKQNPPAPAFAPTITGTGEAFWKSVRAQFVMPAELGVMNAAKPYAISGIATSESGDSTAGQPERRSTSAERFSRRPKICRASADFARSKTRTAQLFSLSR